MKVVQNKVQVSGQVAVMAINALLARIIFDKNPDHAFYIEESFPLDWMYPRLAPHGMILKIHRQPLREMSEEMVRKDRDYWRPLVAEMIGNWLDEDTSVRIVAEFVEKVYVANDLDGFRGDPRFIRNQHPRKLFSKLRASIAGVYAWRYENPVGEGGESGEAGNHAERSRMLREADFAFRQAFAICPTSPESLFRYVKLLVDAGRLEDAIIIAGVALKVEPGNEQVQNLLAELNRQSASSTE